MQNAAFPRSELADGHVIVSEVYRLAIFKTNISMIWPHTQPQQVVHNQLWFCIAKHVYLVKNALLLNILEFKQIQRGKRSEGLWGCNDVVRFPSKIDYCGLFFFCRFFSFLFYRQKSGSFPESKNAINDKSSCTSLKTLWLKLGYIAFFHQRWSGSHRSVLRPQYFDRAVKEWRCGGRLPDCEAAESSEARYGSDKGEYVYRCKEVYFLWSNLTPVSLSKFTGWGVGHWPFLAAVFNRNWGPIPLVENNWPDT